MNTPEEIDYTQDLVEYRDMLPGTPTGPFVGNTNETEQIEEEPNEEIGPFIGGLDH